MDMHMIEALPTQFRAAPAQEGILHMQESRGPSSRGCYNCTALFTMHREMAANFEARNNGAEYVNRALFLFKFGMAGMYENARTSTAS
jgi:hypothetical protein